jgi:hypothetical protein
MPTQHPLVDGFAAYLRKEKLGHTLHQLESGQGIRIPVGGRNEAPLQNIGKGSPGRRWIDRAVNALAVKATELKREYPGMRPLVHLVDQNGEKVEAEGPKEEWKKRVHSIQVKFEIMF